MNTIYSNCTHTIDHEVEKTAMETGEYVDHPAYNFFGYIKYDKDRSLWVEDVWRYNAKVKVFEGPTALSVIQQANDEYGDE